MAARALSDDIQDMVARLGKMANEDLPAIADQMRAEMGAEVAASFNDQMNATLSAHLDATKATKDAMETAIGGITGEAPLGAPGGDMALADQPAPDRKINMCYRTCDLKSNGFLARTPLAVVVWMHYVASTKAHSTKC